MTLNNYIMKKSREDVTFTGSSCYARALSRAYIMLVHSHGFVKKKIKIIWRNTIVIHNVFRKN